MLRPPYSRYDRLFVYHFDTLLPSIDDKALIGNWQEDDKSILFFHEEREELIASLCRQHQAKLVYEAELDYLDWEAGVAIESFQTRLLKVRPLWIKPKDDDSIILDPSVIFGSGFHATTRICLAALENLVPEPEAGVKSVLDLGTGTGLLAIAAARLGAQKIEAVDLNPLSIEVAQHNIGLNNCGGSVKVYQADLSEKMPNTRCDLVIANLYKGLLIQLFENPDFWKGRYYIISGFVPAMEGDLLAALPMQQLRMLERRQQEQWRLWVLENRNCEQA